MASCLHFAKKKALIFHQEDYSLTQLVYNDFTPLPNTKTIAANAANIAQGFGIASRDINYIEDMSIPEVEKVVQKI